MCSLESFVSTRRMYEPPFGCSRRLVTLLKSQSGAACRVGRLTQSCELVGEVPPVR